MYSVSRCKPGKTS